MKNKKIRNDLLLVAVLLTAAATSFLVFSLTRYEGNTVSIIIDGVKTEGYSLSQTLEKEIKTENGKNVLVIENGKAYMKSADCPDKICVEHRPINKNGELSKVKT